MPSTSTTVDDRPSSASTEICMTVSRTDKFAFDPEGNTTHAIVNHTTGQQGSDALRLRPVCPVGFACAARRDRAGAAALDSECRTSRSDDLDWSDAAVCSERRCGPE